MNGKADKIGFVIPWYSEKAPGGAEMELREVVQHLHKRGVPVEILSTCVKDFSSDWNVNFFHEGMTTVHGDIPIRRFKVRKRDAEAFNSVNLKLMNNIPISPEEEDTFFQEMVNSPALYKYISENSSEYKCFVFIPYMFGTTFFGIQACPQKAVVIPCFHNEAYLYIKKAKPVFESTAGMIYNAESEARLANKTFDLSNTKQIVMGIGMDQDISGNAERFREKFGIRSPYIIYAGRKDSGKNVDALIKYFEEYIKRRRTDLKLVLIGGGSIDIPERLLRRRDIIDLGFVNRQDKYDAIAGAQFLCQPSMHESFSLVIMESWLCGRPVLVNQYCDVTSDFAAGSKGGLYFKNYLEFEGCTDFYLRNPAIAEKMGENGGKYVREKFAWNIIEDNYIRFLDEVSANNA